MSTTFELLHCTKNQMLALLPLLCFAMMFLIIGYSINDCTSRVKYEPKRITASIASNHLGEVRTFLGLKVPYDVSHSRLPLAMFEE